MADEHVSPLGSTDGDVAIEVVDAQHDRLVEVNGDTILSPRFHVSSVHHDSSSQRWWVPIQGQERRSTSRQLFRDDLHPLTTIVDIDQWSAETGGDTFSNRVHLWEVLRDKIAGNIETGLDHPEK